MRRRALDALLYFPSRALAQTPVAAGLEFEELAIDTEDGERLHGWWIPAREAVATVLLCHGNGGNIGDRVAHAAALVRAGFGVLAFDYRGYGRSTGRPGEKGTYRDARAARRAAGEPVVYVGESLGGAVALALALESPPAALVLQSTFTGIRDVARVHYPFVPAPLVPAAYPSLERIGALRAPLLVLHGDRDDVVPLEHGRRLFAAAPEPKRLHVVPGAGHEDLVPRMGEAYGRMIRECLP